MLAALLFDANGVVAMERLVAVMWDKKIPATAVRQVQDALSGLLRNLAASGALASLISTRRGGYQIHLEREQLDLLEFDRKRTPAGPPSAGTTGRAASAGRAPSRGRGAGQRRGRRPADLASAAQRGREKI
ncbi:AfsR/SARP family transcriptional regulator [Streptomyces sp. CA-111067]|uniref:AfsR/SARP family transcriptional regulator n=1 Tax=Streptomyces sp. CA-111067 TaxID=3240046 RepID=UPI003D9845A3